MSQISIDAGLNSSDAALLSRLTGTTEGFFIVQYMDPVEA